MRITEVNQSGGRAKSLQLLRALQAAVRSRQLHANARTGSPAVPCKARTKRAKQSGADRNHDEAGAGSLRRPSDLDLALTGMIADENRLLQILRQEGFI
jgi:hypothetical protein